MGGRKYYVNESYFDTWSSNMAYILGFITSDGHVRRTEINFGLNPKDIAVLEFIRSEIGSTQPINSVTFYNKKVKKYYTDIRLSICSVKLCTTLREKFGLISHKTGRENICFEIPENLKWDYVRGIFDGDGSVRLRGSISSYICSSSFVFINQLYKLCDNMGNMTLNNMGIYLLNFNKDDSLLFKNKIYQNNGFRLQRKFDIFDSYIETTTKYTNFEINLIRDNIDNLSLVSELTNISKVNLRNKARRMGFICKNYKFSDSDINFMIKNKGILSNIQIAEKLNRKPQSITAKFYALKKQNKI